MLPESVTALEGLSPTTVWFQQLWGMIEQHEPFPGNLHTLHADEWSCVWHQSQSPWLYAGDFLRDRGHTKQEKFNENQALKDVLPTHFLQCQTPGQTRILWLNPDHLLCCIFPPCLLSNTGDQSKTCKKKSGGLDSNSFPPPKIVNKIAINKHKRNYFIAPSSASFQKSPPCGTWESSMVFCILSNNMISVCLSFCCWAVVSRETAVWGNRFPSPIQHTNIVGLEMPWVRFYPAACCLRTGSAAVIGGSSPVSVAGCQSNTPSLGELHGSFTSPNFEWIRGVESHTLKP